MNQRPRWPFAVFCLASIPGCFQKVSENGGLVFSYQPWVPIVVALAGFLGLLVGIGLLIRRHRFWGICLVIVGPLVLAVLAPGMYLNRVVVGEQGFYSRHGFWWDEAIHDIPYDELREVRVVAEKQRGRGNRYSYYFECVLKSGEVDRVPLGDVMREALPEIAEQFHRHGVPIHIPPDLP